MLRPPGLPFRIFLTLVLSSLFVGAAYAPTWTVCSSGCDFTSIQDAVDSAASGDVIELAAETFVENVSIIEKDLEVRGEGPKLTVVDGNAAGSVFFLDLIEEREGECCGPRGCRPCREWDVYSATLTDLTIRNGAGVFGGGVKQLGGSLDLYNCVVEGNAADSGGGVWAEGFFFDGYVESLNMANCVIRDNIADTGGGIYVGGLFAVITTTTISGNSGSPSAIYSAETTYTPELRSSVVNGNAGNAAIAGWGASIWTTTISGNTGVGVQTRHTSILHSTVTGNDIGIDGVSHLLLRNSIVAGNNLTDCALVENIGSQGNNLFGSSCEATNGSWHPPDLQDMDPLLLPLADNGGPTQTHALQAGSPAIDVFVPYAGNCGWKDQRGVLRPQDGDGDGEAKCDIGAFELAPIQLEIDIKPGSFHNSINPRSRGVIPVAILGSEEFDVADVDVDTLRFGPNEAAPRNSGHLEDVNFDGIMDLVVHFRTQDTGIACGDTEATLTGSLLSGEMFQGTDSLVTVGCSPPARQRPALKERDRLIRTDGRVTEPKLEDPGGQE